MKTAKQINILSETEVPFEVGAGFGSDYNIDLNAPSIFVESSHGMDDVREVFEDDNYIVGTAKHGDIYTKNGYTHRFARNNFVTDNIGNIYSGKSVSVDYATTDRMPGYTPITFERDMLALVWNDRSRTSRDWDIRYTGDAYCIKTISISREPMDPDIPTGYQKYFLSMYAKEINDVSYSNYEMSNIRDVNYAFDVCSFTPTSHSKIDTGGVLDQYNNEADSVICSQSELISWIRNLFLRIGDTGASSTKIINYITENMPYGGTILEPDRTLYFRSNIGWNHWRVGGTGDARCWIFSRTLNPVNTGYHTGSVTPYPLPDGNAGKQWIIPFNSEEEYHAACCTKEVATFPYTT